MSVDTRLVFIPPMLPTLVAKPPVGDDWSTEVKYDGWRGQIVIDRGDVRFFTRNGHDWTDRLRVVADAAAELKVTSAIIDGEIVIGHESGRTSFQELQRVIRSNPRGVLFMAFDLLHLDGFDLRENVLDRRRERLESILPVGGWVQYSESLGGTPAELFDGAERMELEGIVCKRRNSPYVSGNSTNWLKVKTFTETEFEILGIRRDPGNPTMALMGQPGSREYVGSAFVTFGRPKSDQFKAFVEANIGSEPTAFKKKPSGAVQWLRPGIIGTVRHLRAETKLRHAKLTDFR